LKEASESEKCRIISRHTNQTTSVGIQPLKKLINGKDVYLFNDDDIRTELEEYHIRKDDSDKGQSEEGEIDMEDSIKDWVEQAIKGSGNFWVDSDISDYEVKATFGRGADTAGPGDISAKLVDNADRNVMHMCLKLLWNKALANSYFPIWISGHYTVYLVFRYILVVELLSLVSLVV